MFEISQFFSWKSTSFFFGKFENQHFSWKPILLYTVGIKIKMNKEWSLLKCGGRSEEELIGQSPYFESNYNWNALFVDIIF